MKKIFGILPMFILLNVLNYAQPQFQNFLTYINSISDSLKKDAVIDSFITAHKADRIPLAENQIAVFLYKGGSLSVSIAGDFNGWQPNYEMNKVPKSNFFYFTRSFESNARLDYKLVVTGNNWILDPLNPHTCMGGYGPNSELAMPGYVQPEEIRYNAAVPHGTVEQFSLYSSNLGSSYQIKVYLPHDYTPAQSKNYPTVYFQDGYEYIDLAGAVNVLDNLIASDKIEKVIAVFVRPNNRNNEYAFGLRTAYRLFFVNELVPHIDSLFKTEQAASRRLVLGDSYGGNISALISYYHPDVFGNCGLHSGAFQENNYEAYNLFISSPKKDVKFTMVWGTYEPLFTNMRQFRDFLQSTKYDFNWRELPEGHSWGLWRANIDFMLEYIFPYVPAKTDEGMNLPNKFQLHQNYPNPFNPETTIHYDLAKSGKVSLKVFDSLGKEVGTLVDEEQAAGAYSVNVTIGKSLHQSGSLSSGVYLYRMSVYASGSDQVQTKKMVILK